MLVETNLAPSNSDQIVGIQSKVISGLGRTLGIQGISTTTSAASSGRAFGVRGLAANATPVANFGVWGELQGDNSGTAILGWDRLSNPNWTQLLDESHSWAGYFVGNVHFANRIGIATLIPGAKLQVKQGDVYIEDIGKGIIMKDSGGKCWRYTPDTSGQLVSSSITCPN